MRKGPRGHALARQQIHDEGRPEAVPRAGVLCGWRQGSAVGGFDGVDPLGDVFCGEGEVLGAPGREVEAGREGVAFGGAVFADGVLVGC